MTNSQRTIQVWILASSLAVVLCAFVLVIQDGERVAVRWFPGYPLPHSCMARTMFGGSCPGCGLTRSFIHLAQGDVAGSLAMHRIGWMIALAVVLQFPYRGYALLRDRNSPIGNRLPTIFSYTLIVALIGNWLIGLLL